MLDETRLPQTGEFGDWACVPGGTPRVPGVREVVRPIPFWQGPIAPALGHPGGGTQYYLSHAIVDLVNMGYLREVPV